MSIMLTMSLVAALQSAPPAAPESTPASAPAPAERKTCTYEDEPGSNFQRRVCRTEAETQQERQNASKRMSAGTTVTRGH